MARTIASLLGLIIVVGLMGCAQSEPSRPNQLPRLIADDTVADDLRVLAEETWGQFLTTFQARTDCFGDVRLHAAYDLNARAAYDPNTATVTVRVPATPAMLRSALVHEWAHHIEFHCVAQQELRATFLAAQGLPADTQWRPDDVPARTPESIWATIPSEQYAEAAIELVLGRRQIPTTARVSEEAVQVLTAWATRR